MPKFDLGHDCKVNQTVNTDAQSAYSMSLQVLESYTKQGFRVTFQKKDPPKAVSAIASDNDGTRIEVSVTIKETSARSSTLTIQLKGKVHVGGFKGNFATDEKVQDVAKDRLKEEIKKALKSQGLAAAMHQLLNRNQLYALALNHAQQGQRGHYA